MGPAIGVAATVLSAGAGVAGAINAKKAAKRQQADQAAALKKQEADARKAIEASKTKERNQAALDAKATSTGATVQFGTAASDAVLKRGAKKKTGTSTSADKSTGGLAATKVGGL